jgi:hypothetical protein
VNMDIVSDLTGARAGRVLITTFVASLAAGLGGCGSSGTEKSDAAFNGSATFDAKHFAVAEVDPNATSGLYDAAYYAEQGNRSGLPARWVAEAQDSTTALQAERAQAYANEINARSDELGRVAEADDFIQSALSERDVADAAARRMEEQFDAELGALVQRIDAQRLAFETEHRKNERVLETQVLEHEAFVEKLRGKADSNWAAALAEHEQMLAARDAVKTRGDATIAQMLRTAEMTEQRAFERVRALRVESGSVADQTAAEVSDLEQQIDTAEQQTEARVVELNQLAHTIEAESKARVSQILAQAESLESEGADSSHRLTIVELHVDYNDQLEEANQLRDQAVQFGQNTEAEAQRRFAEAEENLELARVMFQEAVEGVSARLEQALARAEVTDAKADEFERSARSAFVAAEIEARVAAAREQAAHQRALAQSEFDKIRADANAEAQKAEAQLRAQIAKQARKGKVTVPANTEGFSIDASAPTPEMARGTFKSSPVKADRVAAFRIGLAKATQLRLEADAARTEARAAHDEENSDFTMWWEAKRAAHATTLAELQAFEKEAAARVDELLAQADGLAAAAEASRRRAEATADSSRKETIAQASLLRAEASAESRRATARIAQVLARVESVRRNGKAIVRNLEARRDATLRRGTAQTQQLLTEASALEQSEAAMVAQLFEQISSARKVLKAELRRLDQSSASFLAVARSDFNESLANADAIERIGIASAAEHSAAQIAERRRTDAEIRFMTDVARNNELIAQARVDRFLAGADAELGFAQADDLASRAGINADRRIAEAFVAERFAAADAREMSVLARFDRRVAQTEADRNRSFAQSFLRGEIQRTQAERAVAAAEAHRDLLNEAVARLDHAENTFNQTAQPDWDTRLAMPANFTTTVQPSAPGKTQFWTSEPQFRQPGQNDNGFGSTYVIAPTD